MAFLDKIGTKTQTLFFVLLLIFNFVALYLTAGPSTEPKNDDSSNFWGIVGWLGLSVATIMFFVLMLCLAYKCSGPGKKLLVWFLPIVGVLASAIAISQTKSVCFGEPGATPDKTAYVFTGVGILIQTIVTLILFLMLWNKQNTQRIADATTQIIRTQKHAQANREIATFREDERIRKKHNNHQKLTPQEYERFQTFDPHRYKATPEEIYDSRERAIERARERES